MSYLNLIDHLFKRKTFNRETSLFTLVNISDPMPTERINDEVYDKIKRIMERMGWKSFSYALEQILKDIDPEKFNTLLQIVRIEGEVK